MSELPENSEIQQNTLPPQTTGTTSDIQATVQTAMETYFENHSGSTDSDLYQMILSEAEQPLFRAVLKHTCGNQTKAAEILGLNRGTLRTAITRQNTVAYKTMA